MTWLKKRLELCHKENVGSIPFGCCFFFYPVCSVLVSFEEVNIFLEKFGLTLVQLGAEKPFRKVWLMSFSVVQIYRITRKILGTSGF